MNCQPGAAPFDCAEDHPFDSSDRPERSRRAEPAPAINAPLILSTPARIHHSGFTIHDSDALLQ
jgi:hypothetical protein